MISISPILRSVFLFLLVVPNSYTFAHNLNGFWKNEVDPHSLIRIDDKYVSLHNGDAHISMEYKSDPSIDHVYHFYNLRFNRLALPASLPDISLTTAMKYISTLKKHGATVKIIEEISGSNSMVIFWTLQDGSGSFLLNRVM